MRKKLRNLTKNAGRPRCVSAGILSFKDLNKPPFLVERKYKRRTKTKKSIRK